MDPIDITSSKFNPFPGLRPFNPEENDFFFGRDSESEEIAGKLLANKFIAVTGASGIGKSSLLCCGLLPALTRISPKSNIWRFVMMKPSGDPVGSLARAFHQLSLELDGKVFDYKELYNILAQEPDGITEVINAFSFKINEKIVLIMDQFEDLFRYGSLQRKMIRENEADRFVSLITNAITGHSLNIYVAISIRSDLISECAGNKNFTQLINHSHFLVPAMTQDNLRQAIEGPIKRAGASIDTDLVEILLEDISGKTDQLLLLQHSLMKTWAKWKEPADPDRAIGYYDYNAVGTVKDSISRHADEIYNQFDDRGKTICERLFKLITGKSGENKSIRVPSKVRNIKSVLMCTDEELNDVIEKYRDPFVSILTPYHPLPLDDDSMIDLTHESLIRHWDRLAKWVDEEADSVKIYQRLSDMSAMYQQGKTGLLKQPELQLAINWRDMNKPTPGWAQRYDPAFERAMVYLRTSEKDYNESEERKERQQRRKLRRIRIISSIFGGIAILAILSMIALSISKIATDNLLKETEIQKAKLNEQKNLTEEYAALVLKRSVEADSGAAIAMMREQQERQMRQKLESRFFAAEAEISQAKTQQDLIRKQSDSLRQAGLLAEEAARTAAEQKIRAEKQRMISLARSMALRSQHVSDQKELQSLLAYQAYLFNSRNGGRNNDADIYMGLYNVAKQYDDGPCIVYKGHEGVVRNIAFVPGQDEFYTSGTDGKVLKWNPGDKDRGFRLVYSGSKIIDVLAVSPDAGWLACGEESAIKMIPLNGNAEAYELSGHSGKVQSLVFSFDGKYLYSASLDGKVLKWDLSIKTSTDITGGIKITSIDLSVGDKFIAGLSDDGKALVWDPSRSAGQIRIESEGRSVKALKFNPEAERIAVGYDDGLVELWDLSSGKKITELKAHSGEVRSIRFNGAHSQMATTGDDGTIKLWDTGNLFDLPVTFNDNGGLVMAVEFSPEGDVILSASAETGRNLVSRPAFADTFAADGCSYVTRNFTPEEWLTYVGNDIAYEKTCPGADYRIRIREVR
ncbi:MAG: WD40 repeat domain-containing protein [Bacteroidales bacterium]|jgi:hypothetical protein|nr:WD40 repeat domain-containing protein [Bacteroidales bacterium]